MKNFLILLLLATAHQGVAQILNIDRENGQDTIKRKQSMSINLNFSSDKQKKNLLELASRTEYDRFLKNDQLLICLLNTDASYNGNKHTGK